MQRGILYFIISICIIIFTKYIKLKYMLVYMLAGIIFMIMGKLADKLVKTYFHGSLFINYIIILPIYILTCIRLITCLLNSFELFVFSVTVFFLSISMLLKEDKEDKDNYDQFYKLLFSMPFIRLILLFVITLMNYLKVDIPFVKDINSGIIFSIALDSVFSLYKKYKENIELKKRKELIHTYPKKQIKEIFKLCETNEGHNPNMFIDLLSREYGGATLASFKESDYFTYVYLKQSCKGFLMSTLI